MGVFIATGILLFIDLESFNIVRRMDVVKEVPDSYTLKFPPHNIASVLIIWCNGIQCILDKAMVKEIGTRPDVIRRLKSIFVREDADEGGTVIVGTSYGDVYVIGIGTNV